MNKIVEIQRINQRELDLDIPYEASWHYKYRDSAWVYVGGLSIKLSEGDIICVMSEFGEIEDINLVRDKETGKSKGFAFVKYEDQKSTTLAVDNLNGVTISGRIINVDHVSQYKPPKEKRKRKDSKDEDNYKHKHH